MKKEYIIIILGVIIALLFVSNYFSIVTAKQLKVEAHQLNQALQQKDMQLKSLMDQDAVKQQELDSVKQKLAATEKELNDIKQDLDNLNKKFSSPKTAPRKK